ncbi:porin [Aquiflexum sp.]|uniref:porin n=1 Tax=Aquiflexum sp. TaxID=1872584 RepID=UPI0035946FA7
METGFTSYRITRRFFYHFFIFSIFLFQFRSSFGQTVESDERALLNVDEGIRFSKDSLFLMNLRFRMQNRAGLNTLGGDEFSINAFEMRVRRLRLRFDGFVGNPKFQYYIQLAFSKADLDLETSVIAQPIRDAIIYYIVSDDLYFGFGQSKLPGNRQRVTSSGNLQFADRSIANGLFNIDRDFGFFAYYTKKLKQDSYLQLKGVVSSGDGRNASAINDGLAYTGRLEYLPFGLFKNNGDYSEGDLEFEPRPKISIGITYSKNFKANKTSGQLGQELFEKRTMDSFILDGVLKYKGNAILAEYMQRTSPDPFTSNLAGEMRFVQIGHGVNMQLSKVIYQNSELALRYSFVVPGNQITAFQQRIDEAMMGYTYYLRGHRIKLQGNFGYKWLEGLPNLDNSGNSWTGMFQVEFGI